MRQMDGPAGTAPALPAAPQHARAPWLLGPLTALGGGVAALTGALDQATKLWLLFPYDLGSRGVVRLAPVLDLVLAWNTGISYGLLPQEGDLGRWLLVAFKVAAAALLWVWLARAHSKLLAVALGLLIGGAVGNAIDRVVFGAVIDFLLLRLDVVGLRFPYVFNLADAAITLGVVLMLCDSLFPERAAKAP